MAITVADSSPRPAGMMVHTVWVDEKVRHLVEVGSSVVVGTSDQHGQPQMVRGWGPRLLQGGRTIEVFVGNTPGAAVLECLRAGRRMAVTCTGVISYRSIQMKGHCVEVRPPTSEESAWIQQHWDSFATAAALAGLPPHAARNLRSEPMTRIEMAVEETFNQTPGPGAGTPL